MFYKTAITSVTLIAPILLTGCSFFESSYVKRERLIKRLPISISVQFIDNSANSVNCSVVTMAIFEIDSEGSGNVEWFRDSGLPPMHGCIFDTSTPFQSQKFKLSDHENTAVRKKLAKIDWPTKMEWRYNVCGLDTNESPPVSVVFGDDYSIPSYNIYPNWIDDMYSSVECQQSVQQEVKIIENIISDFPVTFPAKYVLRWSQTGAFVELIH